MNKFYFWIIIFPALLGSCKSLFAQDKDVTSFLTTRYSERPLTLHRGQFSLSSGYEFSVLNKKYGDAGDALNMREQGIAAVRHLVPVKIGFGLLEYLQFSASLNYASSGLRSINRTIYGYDTFLEINELKEIKGPDQLYLGLTLRAPADFGHFDFSVSGGLNIPVFDNKPGKPEHVYQEYSGSAILNYHYFEKFSTGVMSAQMGAAVKYKHPKFSLFGSYTYGNELEDGKNIYWSSILDMGKFEYSSQVYNFNIGQYQRWEGIVSMQALKWFNLQLYTKGFGSKNGWSDQSGLKLGYPDRSVIYGGLGYEIQVTQYIRLSQQFQLPVAGKNYSASVIFMTGISLNLISARYYNMF